MSTECSRVLATRSAAGPVSHARSADLRLRRAPNARTERHQMSTLSAPERHVWSAMRYSLSGAHGRPAVNHIASVLGLASNKRRGFFQRLMGGCGRDGHYGLAPCRRVVHPKVRLDVSSRVAFAVDRDRYERLRNDVRATLRKQQAGPVLPLVDRACDAHGGWTDPDRSRACAFVGAEPRVEQLAI